MESFNILDVLDEVVCKVACMVAATEKMEIKIEWLNNVIGDMLRAKRVHSILVQKNR